MEARSCCSGHPVIDMDVTVAAGHFAVAGLRSFNLHSEVQVAGLSFRGNERELDVLVVSVVRVVDSESQVLWKE